MELAGYFASVLIGMSLGLIGGGGSILTVPVLVYLFSIDAAQATSYSLFIVGITSAMGAFTNYRRGQVHLPTVLLFAPASILTVMLTRKWIVPAVPEIIFSSGEMMVTRNMATMVLFAILMIAAAIPMIKSKAIGKEPIATDRPDYVRMIGYGILIGLVTGLLGAGGGFLIIPALVFLLKLPIKTAIGTSLLIIALNSLIGFLGDLSHHTIAWSFLLRVSGLAIGGVLIGSMIGRKMDGARLKKTFGFFVLAMGSYILIHELFF